MKCNRHTLDPSWRQLNPELMSFRPQPTSIRPQPTSAGHQPMSIATQPASALADRAYHMNCILFFFFLSIYCFQAFWTVGAGLHPGGCGRGTADRPPGCVWIQACQRHFVRADISILTQEHTSPTSTQNVNRFVDHHQDHSERSGESFTPAAHVPSWFLPRTSRGYQC